MKRLFLIVIIVILLMACTPSSVIEITPTRENKTATLSPSPLATVTLTLTPKPSPTSTPTPIPFLKLSSLPSGNYVAYVKTINIKDYLGVTAIDGTDLGLFVEKPGDFEFAISPNLQYLADPPYIIDLNSGEKTLLEELNKPWHCRQPSWAPNNEQITVSCSETDISSTNIFIFSIRDRTMIQVTFCGVEASECGIPSWSPDGKWIAYGRAKGSAGVSELSGMHIINTECFSRPQTCSRDEEGIRVSFPYEWSPDGRYLMTHYDKTIQLFQIKNGHAEFAQTFEQKDIVDQNFWLNDRMIMFILQYGDAYLLNTESGEITSWIAPEAFHWGSYRPLFRVP